SSRHEKSDDENQAQQQPVEHPEPGKGAPSNAHRDLLLDTHHEEMALPGAGSGDLHWNAAHRLLHLQGLRDAYGQHALVVLGLDVLVVDLERQAYRPREGAEAALHVIGPAISLLVLGLLLALDGEEIAGQRYVEILFLETRHFGRDDELL